MEIRASIMRLALAMEQKLQANEHKADWKACDPLWLLEKLCDEVHELSHALQYNRRDQISDEAADVANFAMMIADTLEPDRSESRGREIAIR